VLYRPRNRSQTDRRTDGRTDGRTDDITISVEPIFLKMCSKNSKFGVINWKKNGCLISSLKDNRDLDEFFERFICGRSRSDDLSSMSADYHPLWLIIIPSGSLWSPVVEYHLQWLIVISIINHHRWYSSLLNEYRFHRMNIVCSKWISFLSDEYHLL
jgi:hypothetical protein